MRLTRLGEIIVQTPPGSFESPPKEEPRPRPVRHFTIEDYQRRIERYSTILAKWKSRFEAEFGKPTAPLDHGVLNTPLVRRTSTDAQLDRYKLITGRIREYEHRVALNQIRIERLADA